MVVVVGDGNAGGGEGRVGRDARRVCCGRAKFSHCGGNCKGLMFGMSCLFVASFPFFSLFLVVGKLGVRIMVGR